MTEKMDSSLPRGAATEALLGTMVGIKTGMTEKMDSRLLGNDKNEGMTRMRERQISRDDRIDPDYKRLKLTSGSGPQIQE